MENLTIDVIKKMHDTDDVLMQQTIESMFPQIDWKQNGLVIIEEPEDGDGDSDGNLICHNGCCGGL